MKRRSSCDRNDRQKLKITAVIITSVCSSYSELIVGSR